MVGCDRRRVAFWMTSLWLLASLVVVGGRDWLVILFLVFVVVHTLCWTSLSSDVA